MTKNRKYQAAIGVLIIVLLSWGIVGLFDDLPSEVGTAALFTFLGIAATVPATLLVTRSGQGSTHNHYHDHRRIDVHMRAGQRLPRRQQKQLRGSHDRT